MLLPKIDSALDVASLIQTLRVYLSRDVLGISGLLFFQHRLGSSTAMPEWCSMPRASARLKRSAMRHGLSLSPLGLAESAAQFGLHGPFDNWHHLLLKPPSSSAAAARGRHLQGSAVR